MTGTMVLLSFGCAAAVAGVVGLRRSWGLSARSVARNLTAWAALIAAMVVGGIAAGAWGMAIVTLAATAAAFAILSYSAITAPAKSATSPSRRAHVLPGKGAARQLPRRLATFLLVVPLACVTSVLIALVLRQATIGPGEANANVTALYATPILWSVLMSVIMMQTRQLVRLATALLPGLTALALLWAWGAA